MVVIPRVIMWVCPTVIVLLHKLRSDSDVMTTIP